MSSQLQLMLLQINGKGVTLLSLLGYGLITPRNRLFLVLHEWMFTYHWRTYVFMILTTKMIKITIVMKEVASRKKRLLSLGKKRQLMAKMMPLWFVQCCKVHSNNQLHYYDFHIVYSASYRVPVFYFRGYCSDGSLLQLNQIEKDLPTCSAKVLLESKWTFITQEEHPYLNRPWYKLHPCGTSEWMKLLFMGDAASIEKRVPFELYLISWFSVVGQVFSFRIPVAMVNHATVTDG
ncbi:ubiquitin-like-conjugating enzyme ATG10 isoform X7 [Mercurialis annua]|uniref:ubiquitin-like-conjugating enzyme ATG10 isoform X7 n=1 Tax=Mercurialis annua TaxID=3986 RepID=UPI0024ACD67D|nr:ubiquitin-like-conjugating enzyme ATG10 isoform X7 [Mercurialis annua]